MIGPVNNNYNTSIILPHANDQTPNGERITEIFRLIETAKRKVESLNNFDKDEFLFEIVKVEAHCDLVAARKTAQLIGDRFRLSAFLEIAKVDPKHDFTLAKKAAETSDVGEIQMILEVEVLYDLEAAQRTAQSIDEDDFNDSFLCTIATEKAKLDLMTAKTLALSIQDGENKDCALFEIVKLEAIKDLEAAKATAQMINMHFFAVKAFLEIAKVDPQNDLSVAKNVAMQIKYLELKAQMLLEVAKVDPQHDITDAKEVAMMLDHSHSKAQILLEIAIVDPKHDFKAVKEEAWQIEGKDRYEWLLNIISRESQYDLEEAKKTARTIGRSFAHYRLIFCLSNPHKINSINDLPGKISAFTYPKELVFFGGNITHESSDQEVENCNRVVEAHSKFEVTNNPSLIMELPIICFTECKAFSEILQVQAQSDFESAVNLTNVIGDRFKDSLLSKIVRGGVKRNLERAKFIAQSIGNPKLKDEALLEVVKEEAKKNIALAEMTVNDISSSTIQIYAFLEIAKAAQNFLKKV